MKNHDIAKKKAQTLNILIVEDTRSIALIESKIVKDAGHASKVAENGAAALKILSRGGIDVVLLDHQLPDTKGSDLLREIIEGYPDIPVIMITGHGDERLVAEVMKAGAKDYIVKDHKSNFLNVLPKTIGSIHRQNLLEIEARQLREKIAGSEKRFQSILDGLDAIVYVSDMETYEILFVNKYVQNIWGKVEGEICWQTFKSGQTGPCESCTNDKLLKPDGKPGKTYTWESWNDITGRWYYIHDTAIQWNDGRIVRLEIATDITELKQAEEKLKETSRKLKDKNTSLERFQKVTVGRELEMIRLKEEVNTLLDKSGQPKKYDV